MSSTSLRLPRGLRSPDRIQSFLDDLRYNKEKDGETARSPRRVVETGEAHCFEGGLFAAAAPPYAIAWLKTGNPIFPFLNQKIHSRLLPRDAEIRDARFRQPLTWHTPYSTP